MEILSKEETAGHRNVDFFFHKKGDIHSIFNRIFQLWRSGFKKKTVQYTAITDLYF